MRKDTNYLKEKLEPVTGSEMRKLNNQITRDPELKRMLTTRMEEIPQYYYLYTSESPYLGWYGLLSFINFLFVNEHRANLYFSKSGNKFTGFVVYEDNGKVIDRIKMASFLDDDLRTNPVLVKDLIEFILDKAPKRQSIEWLVDPQNSQAIRQYNAILNRRGLQWYCGKSKGGGLIKYVVKGGLL